MGFNAKDVPNLVIDDEDEHIEEEDESAEEDVQEETKGN